MEREKVDLSIIIYWDNLSHYAAVHRHTGRLIMSVLFFSNNDLLEKKTYIVLQGDL